MINCQPCLMIQSFHKFYLCMLIYLNVKSHLHVSLSYMGIFPDLTYRMMFTRTAKKELFVRIYYTINFPLLLFFFYLMCLFGTIVIIILTYLIL